MFASTYTRVKFEDIWRQRLFRLSFITVYHDFRDVRIYAVRPQKAELPRNRTTMNQKYLQHTSAK